MLNLYGKDSVQTEYAQTFGYNLNLDYLFERLSRGKQPRKDTRQPTEPLLHGDGQAVIAKRCLCHQHCPEFLCLTNDACLQNFSDNFALFFDAFGTKTRFLCAERFSLCTFCCNFAPALEKVKIKAPL